MAKVNPIQLQSMLKGTSYPASKDDLMKQAKSNKAEKNILDALEGLSDETFENPAEVSKAISAANAD